ncbi:MAG: hypothetical protein J6A21_07250 [Lentisphaeria bacterium]|nr:hypothetical protein [Lentisphaeria bacterium]
MKRVMLFLAGCLFAASIALNIRFWHKSQVPGKAVEERRTETVKVKEKKMKTSPPEDKTVSEKKNNLRKPPAANRKRTPANFFFRGAQYPYWSNEKKIEISFARVPVSRNYDDEYEDGGSSVNLDLDPATLEEAITISPEIPLTAVIGGENLVLRGDFKYGATYLIRLDTSLKTKDGGRLAAPAVFSVKIPHLTPSVRFVTQGMYLPIKAGRVTLPYSVTNVKKIRVEVRKFYTDNQETFRSSYYSDSLDTSASRLVFEKELLFSLPEDKEVFQQLDLTSLREKNGPGVYGILVSCIEPRPRYSWEGRKSIRFIFTDLAVSAAIPEDAATGAKGGVFVRSLSKNLPVAGAEVTLLSSKQQIFARGITDKEGKCVLTIARRYRDDEDRPEKLFVRKGEDIACLDLFGHNSTSHDLSRFQDGGKAAVSGKAEAFLYTQRGICRPGEVIHAGLFLRKEDNGKNSALSGMMLELSLTDPAGTSFPGKTVETDESGSAVFSFKIPGDARTGTWSIAAKTPGAGKKAPVLGSCKFQVGEYVPDRIKAELKIGEEPEVVSSLDSVRFRPSAAYYFGAPLDPSVEGTLSVRTLPLAKRPAHWKDFAVGDPSAPFLPGNFHVHDVSPAGKEVVYPGFAARGGKSTVPVLLSATFTVAEPGGRSVSASRNLPCSVMDCYLGIFKEVRTRGSAVAADWKLLAMREKEIIPAMKRQYAVKLMRVQWDRRIKETNGKFAWEWNRTETPVLEKKIVSSERQGTFELGQLEAGEYVLSVSSGEMKTRLTFWHEEGAAGGRSPNMAELALSCDKTFYRPGDTARISFESPGKGAALIVSGSGNTLRMRAIDVIKGKNTVSVPVPGNVAFETYHTAITLVTGELGAVSRSFALAPLKVDLSASRKLSVAVKHPEKALPCGEIPVSVELKTLAGAPVSGSVHLFGCDAGILALTGWKTPDIYEFFSGRRVSALTFTDMYEYLFPELKLSASGKFGGGASSETGGYLSRVKLKMKAPALFSLGTLRTDEKGLASGKVKLPDFTGSLLISAVAADRERTGSAGSELLVRDRIGGTASFPRAAAPGDEIQGSFTLFNFDLPQGEFSFVLTLPENWKCLSGESSVKGKLAKGGQKTFPIRMKTAEKCGNHTLKYVCTFRSGTETVEKKGSFHVALRHKTPEGSESAFTLLRKGESLTVKGDTAKWHPDGFSVKVTVSGSPVTMLADSLDFLRSYPYGCLEQTASGAFPFLSAEQLFSCGLIGREQAETAKTTVLQAAYRILSMLRYDGSFSMWPGSGPEFRAGTLFASHFLFEAENKTSFVIPGGARELICRHLYRIAENAARPRGERAYASCILSLAKKPSFRNPARNILMENRKDLASLFASFALIHGGYAAEGAYYMKGALEKEVWREKNIPYAYADDGVRMGMVLYLLARTDPENPVCLQLLNHLQKSLRSDGRGWGTTQANAWAVLGISAWAEGNRLGKTDPAVKTAGTLRLSDGKVLPVPAGKAVTVEVREKETISLAATGSEGLFVRSVTRGIPRNGVTASRGLAVKREYLDKDGKPVTRAAHGDLLTVRITTKAFQYIPDAVIVDLLPGGLEIEDGALATRAAKNVVQKKNAPSVKFKENRDDRFLLFCDLDGEQVYEYKVRAVIRGKYAIPAVSGEKMYDPDVAALSAPGGFFEIK